MRRSTRSRASGECQPASSRALTDSPDRRATLVRSLRPGNGRGLWTGMLWVHAPKYPGVRFPTADSIYRSHGGIVKRIRRSRFNPGPPGQRVLSKPKPRPSQSSGESDPPRSGLWVPGGDSGPQPIRSMRQRYAGTGKHLVVKRTEPGTYEPVDVINVGPGKRGHVEVRIER